MELLQLRQAVYQYPGTQTPVLRGVNAGFEQGKLYAVIGKSGSGKSTLLNLMGGLALPTGGAVVYEGTDTRNLDLDRLRREQVAMIYQDYGLFPLLTALENIMYPMELCHVPGRQAAVEAKKLAALAMLPENLLDRYPGQLSGGEQQRVSIARALAMERRLLLADEPTGNLDTENSDRIMDLLKELAHTENRCIIVVTHDMAAMEKADVVYRMVDGVLRELSSGGRV